MVLCPMFLGSAVMVAPVAGVIGAIVPTLLGFVVEGLPSGWKLVGFLLSLDGIWFVTRSAGGAGSSFREGVGLGFVAGILDAGGNIFYLFATQFTRLDIAAVLGSLYPAGMVLLSRLFLEENLTTYQWIGLGLCLAGIALITAG